MSRKTRSQRRGTVPNARRFAYHIGWTNQIGEGGFVFRLLLIVLAGLCAAGPALAKTVPDLPAKRQPPPAWGKPPLTDGPRDWPPEEIAAARRACIEVVARARFDLEPLDPIREGQCGAPAPVSLRALPGDAGLQLVPPATLTCDLGPRANEAHANHFHFDIGSGGICE